jgi:MinD superfamily P-loop ATPase
MKKILVLSGKGGTGKTTISSHFIEIGKSRVYADCDVEAPNLHLVNLSIDPSYKENYYGLGKYLIDQNLCVSCGECQKNCRFNAIAYVDNHYVINPFLCEGCKVCEIVCPNNAISHYKSVDGELNLYLDDLVFSTATLKMGSGNSGLLVTKVKKQLKEYIQEDDLVIIDGPPGIGCPVIAAMSAVDLVLLVAEPSLSGYSDLERIILTAKKFHQRIAICINKADINLALTKQIKDLSKLYDCAFVGKISYHEDIVKAVNQGKNTLPSSKAYQEIKAIFDRTITVLKSIN